MKIAVVQLNPVIGRFHINCEKILDFASKAYDQGCDVVIFPGMALSGYPLFDLLRRPSFIQQHNQAMQQLIKSLPPIDVILGGIETNDDSSGKGFFNAAFVIRNNEIVQIARKQLLQSSDAFDESRYFQPGNTAHLYSFNGKNYLITLGEEGLGFDGHQSEEYLVKQRLVRFNGEGRTIDGIISLAASHYQQGKTEDRKRKLVDIGRQAAVPIVYCNQVGGHDCLLFEGASMVVNGSGEVCCQLSLCKEDMQLVDLDRLNPCQNDPDLSDEPAILYQTLVMGVYDYVTKSGFSSVVLGLSGGIDSALTAAIAVDALGADKVLGISLPSKYSSQGSLDDARSLAANLGCDYQVIPIKELFEKFEMSLEKCFAGLEEDLTEQNLQARIRGNILMALSNKFGHLLLATGNKSEMAVGYCTLYGDMCGGLAVISDVYKQQVYQLAAYVNRKRERIPVNTIEKPPSAELKPDQRDQDDLPDYKILDQILVMYLEQDMGSDEIISRGFDSAMVKDIIRRVKLNEYKRKQAPMGLKFSSNAFGCDRRYPNI